MAIGDTAFEVAVNSQTNSIYVPTNTIVAVIDGNTNSVTNKINRPAPSSSDPVDLPQIVVNETTNTVFVSNESVASVSVINGQTNAIASTVPVGSGACRMAIDSATNVVYVTNCLDSTVTAINGVTNTVAATINVAPNSTGIAVNPTVDLVYVEGSNVLTVINGATKAVMP